MPSGITIQGYSDEPRIRNLSIEVKRGELVLLLGDPGSGKSRLIRELAGIERFRHCSASIAGAVPGSFQALSCSCFLFQRDNFDENREVIQQLIRRLCLRNLGRREAGKLLFEWCQEYSLEELLHKKPADLNLEQVQLLSYAQIILWKPDVVVLDEPLQNLSPSRQPEVCSWISGLKEHASVLAAASSPSILQDIADRTIDLSIGVQA
jgi:ABC-type multidrug transport system ATPase subunit